MTILTRVVNRVLGYHSSRDFARHRGSEVLLFHDSGFFSNCSVLLMSLARAQQHPARIDVSRSFTHFTDEGKAFRWEDFFSPPNPLTDGQQSDWQKSRVAKRLPHHSTYRWLDFRTTNQILQTYFQLSDAVHARAQEIKETHLPVPLDEIAVVCLRGTDKSTEVRQSSVDRYVSRAQRIMKKQKNHRVWVQTDQVQIRDLLLSRIGPRAFALDVLPVTANSSVIHKSENLHSRFDFTTNLLATTWLMSQAHTVITYTGNVGYWIALLRGHTGRLHQLR